VFAAARAKERAPVALGLVGVGEREVRDGIVEAGGCADIAGDAAWVAGAGVAAGQVSPQTAAYSTSAPGLSESSRMELLVVIELAPRDRSAALDGGPAEEGVGLELHGALAFGDAAGPGARAWQSRRG